MFSKYLSHWFVFVFLIWLVCYQLGYRGEKINPYYIVLVLFWGFLFLIGYMIICKGFKFEISFLLFKIVLHSLPLITMIFMNQRSPRNALRTLVVIVALYIIYIKSQGRDLTDSYFRDSYPKSWDELHTFCLGKDNPVYQIIRPLRG